MLSDEISGEEQRTIESQYADHFYTGNYYVCCQNQVKRGELSDDNYIFMKNMNDNDIFIVPAENLSLLLKNELQDGYIGISAAHCGLESIRQAYAESVMMRKKAFVRNKVEAQYGVFQEKIPEGLITEAAKLTEEAARIQRVQLIGTGHTDDLEKSFHQFFYEVKNGRIDEAVFESCMKDFFTEVEKTYQNALETEGELLLECKEIWSENCIDSYEDKVMEFVLQLHEKINSSYDQNKNENQNGCGLYRRKLCKGSEYGGCLQLYFHELLPVFLLIQAVYRKQFCELSQGNPHERGKKTPDRNRYEDYRDQSGSR